MNSTPVTLEDIHDVLSQGPFETGSSQYDVAVVLLASAFYGTDRDVLRRFTRLSVTFLEDVGRRLEAAEIWRDGSVAATCQWNSPNLDRESDVALVLDVMVGNGEAERKWSEELEEYLYREVPVQ